MPKIDFYILPDPDTTQRLQFVCRLIEKAYKQKHRIFIYSDNTTDAHQLDEMLWTYRDDSFLPHNLVGEGPETAPPIQIGIQTIPEQHRDILINLSQQIPEGYQRFARLLEIIANEANAQESARERFRSYRAQGFELNTHKLSTTEA